MDIGGKIRVIRESKGVSLAQLARRADISNDYMHRIETGKVSNIGLEKLQAIAVALEVDIGQFLHSRAELAQEMLEAKGMRPPNAMDAPSFIPNDIPEVGLAQAGRGTFFDNDGLPMENWPKKYHRPSDVTDLNAYVVRVEGDSMEPMLSKGMRLLCVTNEEPIKNDIVVVQLVSGEVMVKQFSSKNGQIVLKSVNPIYEPVVVSAEEVRAIHPVVWIKRK